jgi:hypothetical protein
MLQLKKIKKSELIWIGKNKLEEQFQKSKIKVMKRLFIFEYIFEDKELKSSITATDIEEAKKIFIKSFYHQEIIDIVEDDSYLES